MRNRPVVVAIGAGALPLAVLLGGCDSGGNPAGSATAPTDSVAPAGRSATTAGRLSLVDYSENDGPTSKVILTGSIGDYGTAVSVGANGAVDPDHRTDLKLALRRGSFRIKISDLDKQLVAKFARFPANTVTCSGNVTATGTVPIVAGSGAGSYQKISGTFDLTVTVAEVDATTKCGPSSPFLKQVVIIAGSGTASVD
jgi:hypothetical protein